MRDGPFRKKDTLPIDGPWSVSFSPFASFSAGCCCRRGSPRRDCPRRRYHRRRVPGRWFRALAPPPLVPSAGASSCSPSPAPSTAGGPRTCGPRGEAEIPGPSCRSGCHRCLPRLPGHCPAGKRPRPGPSPRWTGRPTPGGDWRHAATKVAVTRVPLKSPRRSSGAETGDAGRRGGCTSPRIGHVCTLS